MSAVIFLGGCNLRCPHCHNSGLAWYPERYPPIEPADLGKFFAARGPWLDGIVVTGGEPTLAEDLPELVTALLAFGPPVKVDTNGMRPEMVEAVLSRAPGTRFSVDVKAPFEKYPLVTGNAVTEGEAREGMGRIFELAMGHPGLFMFRTTRVPELCDEDVRVIREEILPSGFSLTVQAYVPPTARREEKGHAHSDKKTRRLPGNLVHGTHRPGHLEGAQGQRHPGSAFGQAVGA
ncbi:radical SAM protein [Desulfolutivibrio sulfoxidireducens]|uniref:radical SAM protein n=1 Tax=Desulfolutivibrio sulfoxidireducens TaxID=2773299 RepID=UPI0034A3DB5C